MAVSSPGTDVSFQTAHFRFIRNPVHRQVGNPLDSQANADGARAKKPSQEGFFLKANWPVPSLPAAGLTPDPMALLTPPQDAGPALMGSWDAPQGP
jgi:hypothetical protein